jgi:hypothetical protein
MSAADPDGPLRSQTRRRILELTAAALTQLTGETLPIDITAPETGHIGFVRRARYGDLRCWHLADIDVPTTVRFAPSADVATKFRCLFLCKVKMSLGGF